MSDPRKDAEFEDQHESVAAGDVPDMGNTLRCPECDTKMVRCDEAGVIALDRLRRDAYRAGQRDKATETETIDAMQLPDDGTAASDAGRSECYQDESTPRASAITVTNREPFVMPPPSVSSTKALDLAWRIRMHIAEGVVLKEDLEFGGTSIIRRLMDGPNGYSLRGIARRTGLSPTYLSLVSRRKQTISFGAYLKLVDLRDNQNQTVSDLET